MNVIDLIKTYEGIKAKPYRCPALLWTVGCGHVLYPAQAKLPMDQRMSVMLATQDNRVFSSGEIDALLNADLARFRAGVLRYCPIAANRQGVFNALVSFSFNVGLGSLQKSTIRMKTNRGDFIGAANEFMKWTKAGGKVLPGLVKRRAAERALYLTT